MIELILKGALSYLLGSIVGSLAVARLTGGADIRTLGSGNAGATNALRTQGRKVALVVLVIDLAKGWIATAMVATWAMPAGISAASAALAPWNAPVCGLAVMLGHVYPLWYGFRGGKGVATLLGAVLGIKARLLLPMILTWLAAVIAFGYVGLASILGAVALAVALALTRSGTPLLVFGILSALLILYTHRSNLARMRAGTESRARRLWLFGTRRGHA
ncbi:MAG TPA: glycerol-3-phosphate 1-O-acyltransferase PlsY [Steroidobacteraceae bacterium]